MANSRLSFSIAVKLLTENFKSGTTVVKSQLRSIQMQAMSFAAALGAGTIGLGNFISKLVETAKETSRANIALKNISGSAEAYLANQKWLVDISKKYGVNINSLTSGYTKFKAAADVSNMSLVDQRKIFESVSRASVAFGLSSEDQKGVFLALSQMMSKNKISSEELRLQMAERLPVAIQAMAKAAGASVGELDKLMKQGKVLAADVLPRFADALNEMIPNVDTDNLNKSLSDLGNTFVEFTKNLNVEGIFKSLVETATSALGVLANNVKLIFAGIKTAIFFALGGVVKNALGAMLGRYSAAVSAATNTMDRLTVKSAKVAQAQRALDEATVKHNAAKEAEKVAIVNGSEEQKRIARQTTHNAEIALNKRSVALVKAQEAQKAAAAAATGDVAKMAAKKGATGWTKFGGAAMFAIRGIGTALKSLAASTLITAVIGGAIWLLNSLIGKIRDVVRISNIVKSADRAVSKPVNDSTADTLRTYKKILDDTANSEEKRKGALNAINGLLGTQYEFGKLYTGEIGKQKKNLEELNQRIADQIKLISLRNRASQMQTVVDDAQAKIDEITSDPEYVEKKKRKESALNKDRSLSESLDDGTGGGLKWLKWDSSEIMEQLKVVGKYKPQLEGLINQITGIEGKYISSTPHTSNPGADSKKSELQKQEEEYAAAINELKVKRELDLISADEYSDAEHKLVEQMYIKAKTAGVGAIPESSEYFKTLQSEYNKSKHGEALKAELEYADILKKYNDGVKEQTRLLDAGAITYDDYRDTLFDLAQELKKQLVSQGLSDQGNLIDRLTQDIKQNAPVAKAKTYDNSRDYKKNDTDILSGQLDVAKENADSIRALYEKNATLYTEQLNAALGNVKSLEDALKIAEAMDAVQNLSKEIRQGLYEGTKNIVSNVDGIVSSFERVGDVLSDSDASAWEKMMAVWQAMISIGDAISQTADFIEKMALAKDMLGKAEMAQAAASTSATAINTANAATGMATDATETASEVSNAGVKIGAAQGAAMAKAGESTAGIPFPWNLVAMAGVMAGVMALFSAIPRFEKGGIVGGNSKTGDKILARINSGEMILNQGQQGTLYGLLNSGTARNVHVTGEFKMRGRDMMAVIDKNNRIKERVG